MVDTKKGARGVVKATAAAKSVAESAKAKIKAASPLHHRDASIAEEPESVVSALPEDPVVAVAPVVAAVTLPVEVMTSRVAPKAAALRQAMGEAVSVSAQGALAVNDKVIDALQSQSNAALDLWRTSVAAPHISDVFRLQSNGARQAYELASAQWKDIAETTAHWFTKAVEPLSSAISDLKR